MNMTNKNRTIATLIASANAHGLGEVAQLLREYQKFVQGHGPNPLDLLAEALGDEVTDMPSAPSVPMPTSEEVLSAPLSEDAILAEVFGASPESEIASTQAAPAKPAAPKVKASKPKAKAKAKAEAKPAKSAKPKKEYEKHTEVTAEANQAGILFANGQKLGKRWSSLRKKLEAACGEGFKYIPKAEAEQQGVPFGLYLTDIGQWEAACQAISEWGSYFEGQTASVKVLG